MGGLCLAVNLAGSRSLSQLAQSTEYILDDKYRDPKHILFCQMSTIWPTPGVK